MTAPSSSTDIGNLALDMLLAGTVGDIENPDDAIESLLSRWYDLKRQALLRSHTWNFAKDRAVLASSSTTPDFGFTKEFPVPSDFLRLCSVESDEGNIISAADYRPSIWPNNHRKESPFE